MVVWLSTVTRTVFHLWTWCCWSSRSAPPTHNKSLSRGSHIKYVKDIALNLVFFSAFEDRQVHLRATGIMESYRNYGIRKLSPYEPLPVPTLYVGRVEDLLGRVPLFPCFLDGNTTSTIPYKYAGGQLDDKSRPSNSGVLTTKALHHPAAAMYMRSTTCCGIWQTPLSLELEDLQCPKLKGSAESPGPRHPGALGRPGRPARWLQMRYDMYIPGICLVYTSYTCQIFMLSKNAFWGMIRCSPPWLRLVVICTCKLWIMIADSSLSLHYKSIVVHLWHIPCIDMVYPSLILLLSLPSHKFPARPLHPTKELFCALQKLIKAIDAFK